MSIVSNQVNPVLDEGTKDLQQIMDDFQAKLSATMDQARTEIQALMDSGKAELVDLATAGKTDLQALMDTGRVELSQALKDTLATAAGYEVVLSIRPKTTT